MGGCVIISNCEGYSGIFREKFNGGHFEFPANVSNLEKISIKPTP